MPIVFARAEGALWMPIDGKPKRGDRRPARLAQLERAPGVMLVLDHYDDDWSRLWWIRLRCTASVITGKHPAWGAAEAALAGSEKTLQANLRLKEYNSVGQLELDVSRSEHEKNVADVAQMGARLHHRDAAHQALIGDLDQALGLAVDFAHHVHAR